jgi:hypothetical protein
MASIRRLNDCSAGRRARVACDQADVEPGIDADDTGHGGDGCIDLVNLPIRADLAVEERDVVVNRHMDVREIEALLEWAERRSDAIGENEVDDIGVRATLPQPVDATAQASAHAADPAGERIQRVSHRGVHRRVRSDARTQHRDATDDGQTYGKPLRCSSPATGSVRPLPTHVMPPCNRSSY